MFSNTYQAVLSRNSNQLLCTASEDRKSNNELKLQEKRFRLNNIRGKSAAHKNRLQIEKYYQGRVWDLTHSTFFKKSLSIQNCQRGFGF